MDHYEEGLITLSIYLLFLSAVCIPVVVGWFTHQFNKRLTRLDKVLSIIEENEKHYEAGQDSGGNAGGG